MEKDLLEHLKRTADAIVAVFGSKTEVVIHDFSDIHHSIVHVAGDITGRAVGGPVSHHPYRIAREQGAKVEDMLGYRYLTKKGRVLKCSTVFIRDKAGRVVGCFSINFDVSEYLRLSTVMGEFTAFSNGGETPRKDIVATTFPETVESVIDNVVLDFGKPPSDMTKDDRIKIVGALERAGAFMYKGAVPRVAQLLGTSRYTIYGYLRETRSE